MPGARFLIAGRGQAQEIREELARFGDSVVFLGGVSDEDKAAMLASASCYVAPQTGGESFGIVLVEAMAAGTRVIASDLKAFSDVLGEGRYGALFRNEDGGDLARVIIDTLQDATAAQARVQAASRVVGRYDWSAVTDEVLDVYDMALSTAHTRVRARPRFAHHAGPAARCPGRLTADLRSDEEPTMAATMTTAMTQPVDIPAGSTTALPALSSTGTGVTTAPMWSIVVLLVGLAVAAGWALYARAVRVDRLHRQVLGARATLEAQLVHRAEAAAELATVPALDPASGLLLSRAAREALDAEGPLVDDGLDTSMPLEGTPLLILLQAVQRSRRQPPAAGPSSSPISAGFCGQWSASPHAASCPPTH